MQPLRFYNSKNLQSYKSVISAFKNTTLFGQSVVWLSKVKPQSLRELASQFASNKNNHTTLLRSTLLEQLLLYHLQTLCKTVYMYLLEGLMED